MAVALPPDLQVGAGIVNTNTNGPLKPVDPLPTDLTWGLNQTYHAAKDFGTRKRRVGMTITTAAWMSPTATSENKNKMLTFWINPSESQWRIATRTSIEMIQGGAIHHEWRTTSLTHEPPRGGSKFDPPVVSFSFQAGNISMPTANSFDPKEFKDGHPGLDNFYRFLDILNQPAITEDGSPNYVIISYSSHMFPHIELKGFFTSEGVQWTETADNPNTIVGWGSSFMVFYATPELDDYSSLVNHFSNITSDV